MPSWLLAVVILAVLGVGTRFPAPPSPSQAAPLAQGASPRGLNVTRNGSGKKNKLKSTIHSAQEESLRTLSISLNPRRVRIPGFRAKK